MDALSLDERKLPHEISLSSPPYRIFEDEADRFIGSIVGLATGDALGACFEFRPRDYFIHRPVQEMVGGGTWGLPAGHWTDDTSMALCLASSLITKKKFDPYDQMVRYKHWYERGYMSSTGRCFDIGNATRDSLEKFKSRQTEFARRNRLDMKKLDSLPWEQIQSAGNFEINCSAPGVAGNGALMRLAPVPLFFYRHPELAVEYAGRSGRLTHGDEKAVDACRYYAALIVAALMKKSKSDILDKRFYDTNRHWFGTKDLHPDILRIARGSFMKNGYEGGIRGKGYVVDALEAALWAFYSTNSFEDGALAAVNLGDDTDTTAAIYGQLAGAVYGYRKIPTKWTKILYAHDLLVRVGEWLHTLANQYNPNQQDHNRNSSTNSSHQSQINNESTDVHHDYFSGQYSPYGLANDYRYGQVQARRQRYEPHEIISAHSYIPTPQPALTYNHFSTRSTLNQFPTGYTSPRLDPSTVSVRSHDNYNPRYNAQDRYTNQYRRPPYDANYYLYPYYRY